MSYHNRYIYLCMSKKLPRLCMDCLEKWAYTGYRCAQCQDAVDAAREATKRMRYDKSHKAMRAMWKSAIAHEPIPCARCGETITSDVVWHLDHLADGQVLPSHQKCNLRASHTDGNRQ